MDGDDSQALRTFHEKKLRTIEVKVLEKRLLRLKETMHFLRGSRILRAAGRLEFLVVFGPFWPLEVSIGTKI